MKLLSSSSRYCTRVDCAVLLQPYFEPSAQKRDSPVSHSYITRQLNNIAASLLTQEEYFSLPTPSDSSVSQKSCLACSADFQGREAALPEVPAWADAAVQEQWQQPVLATSWPAHAQSVLPRALLPTLSHPSWSTVPLWLDSLALACSQSPILLTMRFSTQLRGFVTNVAGLNLSQSLSAPMCRHRRLKCCLLLLCSF